MTFFDLCAGCRMHLAFLCIYGLFDDFSFGMLDFLYLISCTMLYLIDIIDFICCSNVIFILRLRGLAIFDLYDISFTSCSGCLARSVGIV